MAENKVIDQPDVKAQMIVDSIMADEPTDVLFRGKRYTVGWLRNGAIRKFTHVVMKEKNIYRRNVKICTILLLNNVWKIKFLYWIWWRWLYYMCDLDDVEMLKIVDVAKKKIPSTASSLLIILVTGMKDVMMTMTKMEAEASATQAEQPGGQPTR